LVEDSDLFHNIFVEKQEHGQSQEVLINDKVWGKSQED
jgi:hypothetical protein